jgi:hypothetical protein
LTYLHASSFIDSKSLDSIILWHVKELHQINGIQKSMVINIYNVKSCIL